MLERVKLECPFCGKKDVVAIYIPSHLKSKVSRTSAKAITKFYKTKEKYEVQDRCPNCGKSAKQIQKALDEGVRDPEKDKRILKRLKEQGLDFSNVTTRF